MKYKVILNGEDIVSGETPRDIVCEIMKLERTGDEPRRIRDYMARTKKRVHTLQPAQRIRTNRSDLFLEDMCAAGFLERVEESA